MHTEDARKEQPPIDRAAASDGSVFLIGMMGAGKTSVGRLLAQRLGKRFIDADQEIEARCGVTIPVIFEIEGEAGFRQRECSVIEELTRQPGIVLATGGGAVLAPESRHYLASRGLVIYLKASANEIWQRTRRDRGRPLLATPDPQRRIAELLAAREPLYAEAAHITVESTHESLKSMVTRLVNRIHPAHDGALVASASEGCDAQAAPSAFPGPMSHTGHDPR
jgi:shikimate kinase